MKYELVIGLETHVELATDSKPPPTSLTTAFALPVRVCRVCFP